MRIITSKLFVVFACTSFAIFAQNNTTNQGVDSGEQGENNSFFGFNAGRSNTTGKANVFVGSNAGRNNIEGDNNVFDGNAAGFSNTSGNFNTFLGAFAGRENNDGKRNVFIGGNAGRNATGNGNVLIGYRAGFAHAGNNKLFIDNSDTGKPLLYGDFAKNQVGINTNTIPAGYQLAVDGNTNIDGNLFSTGYGIFRGQAVRIGKEWAPTRGQIEFNATDDILFTNYMDINGIQRHYSSFTKDATNVVYFNNNEKVIFRINQLNFGEDEVTVDLPKPKSRVIIGSYGDYLKDQGHKLIVRDGTALIENAIYTNGRIAIGTTEEDPGYALTVKGKVHVQEVKVDLLGVVAPDYVFYKDYQLKTLEQVEDYIDQQGHLPNMPSASELEAEGINLKEMNMRLLEKVEELTLYTIAQQKAIKDQQAANDDLGKRLKKLEKLLQE